MANLEPMALAIERTVLAEFYAKRCIALQAALLAEKAKTKEQAEEIERLMADAPEAVEE